MNYPRDVLFTNSIASLHALLLEITVCYHMVALLSLK